MLTSASLDLSAQWSQTLTAAALISSLVDAMHSPHAHYGLLFALILAAGVLMQACSGPAWLHVRHIPENGYESTLNYQFQAQVHADSLGHCKQMNVRVKALNKFYSKDEPPPRLQLFDDDCMSPIRFERVQYISRETGAHVRLSGPEVGYFLREYGRLEDELMGWLWRAGII